MRLLLLAAVVLFVFALIAAVDSTGQFLTAEWNVWVCGGLIAWTLDQLVGGYILPVARRDAPPQ